MRRTPRRIHLIGDTMTACGKVRVGNMQTARAMDPFKPPDWYCPQCVQSLANYRAIRAQASTVRQVLAAARPEQPTLFPLVTDARPRGERTAAERYLTPSLFTKLEE